MGTPDPQRSTEKQQPLRGAHRHPRRAAAARRSFPETWRALDELAASGARVSLRVADLDTGEAVLAGDDHRTLPIAGLGVVPLLVETGQAELYDLVVVVDVPVETQIERLASNRGMSRAEAESRIAAQATREQRRGAADVVIDNSGTLADLADAVDALWQRLAPRGSVTPPG